LWCGALSRIKLPLSVIIITALELLPDISVPGLTPTLTVPTTAQPRQLRMTSFLTQPTCGNRPSNTTTSTSIFSYSRSNWLPFLPFPIRCHFPGDACTTTRRGLQHSGQDPAIMNILPRTAASAPRILLRSRFQASALPCLYTRQASTMSHSVPKLNDPSLLKTNVAYVNGEWVKAKSGKTFEVTGMYGLRFQ
jgi:hypothetical protein